MSIIVKFLTGSQTLSFIVKRIQSTNNERQILVEQRDANMLQ
jgi:hypothetical protein